MGEKAKGQEKNLGNDTTPTPRDETNDNETSSKLQHSHFKRKY